MTRPIPPELMAGPFTHATAHEFGVTEKMLRGRRFVRLFPRVWRVAGVDLDVHGWIQAARLALPERAHVSHLSRVHDLGLFIGDPRPIHFTVSGDLHLRLPGVFLHRTEVLPPCDERGVTPAAAFVQACATGRLLDLIVIGDWLIHREHATTDEIAWIARTQSWRPGAAQSLRVLPHLDGLSRSPKESRVRAYLVFSGLPVSDVNAPVYDGAREIGIVDLLYRVWMLAIEYEGRQHAEDPWQFARDIERYADFRAIGLAYLQVTAAMEKHPRSLVTRIHRLLAERGYSGPAPIFAGRWDSLFAPVRAGR